METRAQEPFPHVAPGNSVRERERERQNQRSALWYPSQFFEDRLRTIPLHHSATIFAMERSDLRKKQFQVVVQLGHGAHGGAGGLDRAILADGDGGGNSFDALNVRLVHPLEEL